MTFTVVDRESMTEWQKLQREKEVPSNSTY